MRGKVIQALHELNAIAVENPVLPGTPDVNYVEGWIELKWLRAWPTGSATVVPIKHFTPQQRVFHIKRRMAGGHSWVLIQCRREWLLFIGEVAAFTVGQCTRQELYDNASARWSNGLDVKELTSCISEPMKKYCFTDVEKAKLRELLRKGTGSHETDT